MKLVALSLSDSVKAIWQIKLQRKIANESFGAAYKCQTNKMYKKQVE